MEDKTQKDLNVIGEAVKEMFSKCEVIGEIKQIDITNTKSYIRIGVSNGEKEMVYFTVMKGDK